MPLSVDIRKIIKAEVVPWEIDEGLYGVAYTTAKGWEGADLIGTKAEAEAVVQAITDQKIVAFDTALKRIDAKAATRLGSTPVFFLSRLTASRAGFFDFSHVLHGPLR